LARLEHNDHRGEPQGAFASECHLLYLFLTRPLGYRQQT
jgi:hypothetical protein